MNRRMGRRPRLTDYAAVAAAAVALVSPMVGNHAPDCWEDEVVVMVVHDPYGPMEGTLGCVPADDLPTNGYRPVNHERSYPQDVI